MLSFYPAPLSESMSITIYFKSHIVRQKLVRRMKVCKLYMTKCRVGFSREGAEGAQGCLLF